MTRGGGLIVPGLTDRILERLGEPFAMIAAWSAFAPLRLVLPMMSMNLVFGERAFDRVVIDWRHHPGGRRFDLPSWLFEATRQHVSDTWQARQPLLQAGQWDAMFFHSGCYVTEHAFLVAAEGSIPPIS